MKTNWNTAEDKDITDSCSTKLSTTKWNMLAALIKPVKVQQDATFKHNIQNVITKQHSNNSHQEKEVSKLIKINGQN